MPFKAAGERVPLIGPRSRYDIISARNSTWIYHRMKPGSTLNGAAPADPTHAAAEFDPAVSAGRAEFAGLSAGGLFTLLGNAKTGLIIDGVDNAAGATLSTVDKNGATVRVSLDPSKLPLHVSPAEYLKATGGSAGSYVGFLVRVDDVAIL